MPRDGTGEGGSPKRSTLLIFLLGTLTCVLTGGALCVRYLRHVCYLRHEIAADIWPRLRRLQLDNLESAVNLVLVSRYAEIASQPPRVLDPRSDDELL